MKLRTRLAAGFFVAVCFSTLVGRLWYLQIHEYDFYAQRAAGQQLRDSVVPAPRGDILDANGTPLAVSASCWTIRAVPREMADEDVAEAAAALGITIFGVKYRKLRIRQKYNMYVGGC